MSDELEELKKKRLLEALQKQQSEAAEEQARLEQQIRALEMIVKRVLTKEAVERYSNIKAVDPQRAVLILAVLGQLIEQKKITRIDDAQFKELLREMSAEKHDFKIKRK
ncbi:hypothetical protein D6745_01000 [Candidatus Woesearchaeota archaeon]|nr:MAG: hypothetical protein D6745_01000 [Candidatus Woesearchaeota archaeon]